MRFSSMFAMGSLKNVEFLPLFAKGRWGFLRCVPRFWNFETPVFGGAGGRNHGDAEGTEGGRELATDEQG